MAASIQYTAPYIEKHAIIKKGLHTKGIIVYGVPEQALDEIFQLNHFAPLQSEFHSENGIIIGSKLAESINININDDLIIFNPKKIYTHQVFDAKIFTVVNICRFIFYNYSFFTPWR